MSTPLYPVTVDAVEARLARPYEPRIMFSSVRWPFTYSADLLRAHPYIVPDEVHREFLTGGGTRPMPTGVTKVAIDGRMDAGRVRKVWATLLRMSDYDLAEVLATVHCRRKGIEIPQQWCTVATPL